MISFAAEQRRHEIGIRVALGARRRQIIGLMMADAASLLIAGLAIGAACSRLAGQSAASLLFRLEPDDPLTLLAACGLLALITAVATYVPARGASKLDPLAALRHD
jgi:ABC-type antimicrobial peptide transport system permease subunit